MARCACCCNCEANRVDGCNDLCETCWRSWAAPFNNKAKRPKVHEPIADRSYLGMFGLRGLFTGWIMNRASQLLAFPGLTQWSAPPPPKCPHWDGGRCGLTMLWRPGAYKCFHHDPPEVIPIAEPMPVSPQVSTPLIRLAKTRKH